MHVIGFGRALGATIANPDSFQFVFSNLSQRVLTPQTVFSFYSPTATLPNQPTLLRAGVPALSAGPGHSARQLHLRHHHRPVRLGVRDRPLDLQATVAPTRPPWSTWSTSGS